VTSVTSAEQDKPAEIHAETARVDQRVAMNSWAEPATRIANPHAKARKINFLVLITTNPSGRGNAGISQA
jgi:hypothetical protein